MRRPYTRFYLLKKRNIFEDELEQIDHIELRSEIYVLARAVLAAFWALMPETISLTSN